MTWLSYYLYRVISWVRYAVPRRFTPAGGLALAALAAGGAMSLDIEQTVAFQGFALVLCLLAVAMAAAVFFRGPFAAQRTLPKFGTVDQLLAYHVVVRNRTARRLTHLEVLENFADPRPDFRRFVAAQREERQGRGGRWHLTSSPPLDHRQAIARATPLPMLPPHGQGEARVELLPLRRGPLRLNAVTVARPDPFGWFRSFVRVPLPESILILPKRYPLPPLDLPGTREYQPGGVALAAAIGESEEFLSLRDYRPGDPMRHIHWRTWARTGRPFVREFEDEFLVRHALILDTFARPGQGVAFEEAVSVAASFACTVNTQESLLDLLFVGLQAVCFTSGRGLGQTEQTLEILAAVQPSPDSGFEALHSVVLRHARKVCGCILILLEWDAPRRELVRQLRAFGMPLLILVVATPGRAAELERLPVADRPENFHVLEIGKIAAGLQQLGGVS